MSPEADLPVQGGDGSTAVPGRVRVREQVLEKVARETAAAVVGVPRGDVSVDLGEWRGGLALRVNAKLGIPDLGDDAAIAEHTNLLDHVSAIQAELQNRVGAATGRKVHRVAVTITGAIVAGRKRVR